MTDDFYELTPEELADLMVFLDEQRRLVPDKELERRRREEQRIETNAYLRRAKMRLVTSPDPPKKP